MGLNATTVSGRIVGTPRPFPSGKGVSFTVNTGKYDAQERKTVPNFINVKALGEKTANMFGEHFGPGKAVELTGRLEQSSYENKDGVKMTAYDVVTDRLGFVPQDKSEDVGQANAGSGNW